MHRQSSLAPVTGQQSCTSFSPHLFGLETCFIVIPKILCCGENQETHRCDWPIDGFVVKDSNFLLIALARIPMNTFVIRTTSRSAPVIDEFNYLKNHRVSRNACKSASGLFPQNGRHFSLEVGHKV